MYGRGSMPNIAFFVKQLSVHIIRKHISYADISSSVSLSLFDADVMDIHDNNLYIGSADNAVALFSQLSDTEPATIFLSQDNPCLPTYFDCPWNIISTDLPLIDLYSRINTLMRSYRDWNRLLTNAMREDKGIGHIVELAGGMLNGHILLFNPGMHLLESTHSDIFSDPIVEEAVTDGFLSYETMQKLTNESYKSPLYPNEVRHLCPEDSEHQYYLHTIKHHGNEIAKLIFVLNDGDYHLDIANMISHMGSVLRPLLIQNSDILSISGNHFASLLNDFDTNKPLSGVEIRDRIRFLPCPVRKYIRCFIVTFCTEQPSSSYNLLLSRLAQLLPGTNMTIWNNSIIILQSADKQEFQNISAVNMDVWNALLDEFQAKAVISNSVSTYDSFRTIYYLTLRLSKILSRMHITNPYRNMIFYDDYALYLVIDMAAEQFQHKLSSNDIILFAAPVVITLTRYDKQHNTNLRDVLYHYIRNGRSVSKTAEIMYMHRNTVLNKLKKIQELCPLDLEDGISTEILMFSCQLTKYYEEYMNLELRL